MPIPNYCATATPDAGGPAHRMRRRPGLTRRVPQPSHALCGALRVLVADAQDLAALVLPFDPDFSDRIEAAAEPGELAYLQLRQNGWKPSPHTRAGRIRRARAASVEAPTMPPAIAVETYHLLFERAVALRLSVQTVRDIGGLNAGQELRQLTAMAEAVLDAIEPDPDACGTSLSLEDLETLQRAEAEEALPEQSASPSV